MSYSDLTCVTNAVCDLDLTLPGKIEYVGVGVV